ncbi:AAA family ATPase [Mycoplasmopsis adleri]|uniref:AAA family ATPase n=1 Tax=Mycoplasmopsis adleri TaxID=51362 RepID=UPI0038730E74
MKELEENSSAFIIDCSDFIFDNKSQLPSEQLASLLEQFTLQLEHEYIRYLKKKSKLILIVNNSEIFNSISFNSNPEVLTLNISKPDNEERKAFFGSIASSITFKNKSISLNDEKVWKEAISITDGLSFREIFQMLRVLYSENNKEVKFNDFKSLYRMIYFSKKDSEWEKNEPDKIKKLDEFFNNRIIGQESAISALKKTLIRSLVGLQGIVQSTDSTSKPRGILFFAGPTGVGKTEMAKALSEFVFGDEKRIIRFDMSEYNHEESDQKLIGSAPGYVGYEAGGQLTNAVLEKPFSILLFDEIEKANGKIMDKFLQILEDGRLTSSKGEMVDFSETFIIFTSNIGSNNFQDNFDAESSKKHFIKAVIDYFTNTLKRPEILNRIGIKNIVPFIPLNDEAASKIVELKFKKIAKYLEKNKNIKLAYDNKVISGLQKIVIQNADKSMGGRGLVTRLESIFVDNLSQFIFEHFEKFDNFKTSKIIELETKLSNGNSKIEFNFNIK